MIYNHFMFNRHSLLLEKNQCDPLEIQASERKANLSYTTRLPYSKPQERYLKKKRVGERDRNKEHVYNKQKFNVFIKCDPGGQMSYPPTPSEKSWQTFPWRSRE